MTPEKTNYGVVSVMSYSRAAVHRLLHWIFPDINDGSCVDSTVCSFAWHLNSPSQLPADFEISQPDESWQKAVFIPGARQPGFPESSRFPKIYILSADALTIYSHPKAKVPPFVARLDELTEISSQKIVFYGSIELSTIRSTYHFFYDSTHQRTMNWLLRTLRAAWLKPAKAITAQEDREWESKLDIECLYAVLLELDPSEKVLGVFAEHSQEATRRFALCRNNPSEAAYFICTDRRMMRIASRKHFVNGVSIRYAPNAARLQERIVHSEDGLHLYISLLNGHVWRICLDAADAAQAMDTLHRQSSSTDSAFPSDEFERLFTHDLKEDVSQRA